MAKLKALAGTAQLSAGPGGLDSSGKGHSRSRSTGGIGWGGYDGHNQSVSAPHSPTMERFGSGSKVTTLREEGSDADAEATENEGDGAQDSSKDKNKRKRRTRRPPWTRGDSATAPTTPRQEGFEEGRGFMRGLDPMRRRNTLPEAIEDRGAASEGEGVGRMSAWRRGSAWVTGGRGNSYTGSNPNDDNNPNSGTPRRPGALRRLTGMGGSDNEVSGMASPKRPFMGFDRSATAGAAVRRWGVMRHGLKLLGQKKEVHLVDYKKSAELMAELRAGAPAALMLASMIQRDEHGNKRIPVLLGQLKLSVTDSLTDRNAIFGSEAEKKIADDTKGNKPGRSNTDKEKKEDKEKDTRHQVFRIELEYGSGQNRMKWVIDRTLRDFLNLHIRYKLQASTDKYLQLRDERHRPKQPRFPRSAFPYLRGMRGLGDSSDEDEAETKTLPGDRTRSAAGIATGVDTAAEETDVPPTSGHIGPSPPPGTPGAAAAPGQKKKKHIRPAFTHRRKSSVFYQGENAAAMTPEARRLAELEQKRLFNERQRKKLEEYMQAMIRWLVFRADSNRLCKFLELSALGVRLAAEGSYHGKEGFLVVGSTKGIDFRRILTPRAIFKRHAPKWFLVRHSYMVCVDSPENMVIYDVFLLDSRWSLQAKDRSLKKKIKDTNAMDIAKRAKTKAAYPQHHRLKISNSEMTIDLLAKNERILRQFEASIRYMVHNSLWSKPNRFDSFAPVRHGVYAQWLVDGRDYMWNVSRAINMAKDVIYIHDWWLSPQLYMRRPAAISQKWRLDRLLRKKAREGVKVFIIIYRNVEAAVPIDSEFTKSSMLDLHPNVFVQRSPNQFKKNQFFFAHHEKICIVDHTVAFVGGIDLCFGRWDTPQHSVCDDKPTGFEPSDEPKDADHCQLWPGKDYSNPRVQDFYQLDKPYAEMYDRAKTPRMPWHDVSMQVVGQPARDLTRHFVQRWNYVLRGRNPTRPTPFLLPPPDYNPAELEELGLIGTCEVQILRSACNWSLGIDEPEHSIMNAYCKMIEESEHFVYMENQFFITSCETMGVKIVNKIGDAIVERAVRAAKNGENWRCVILIPLMPGFQNTVDAPDGTSVRLIMQCQFRSISRGEQSIFGRLRNEGIEPEDFVSFYSLRAWGKIGPKKSFVTEQLYIHAKVIIVDDRIALIGSANINERSMLGTRDSECASVVRDTDMLYSTMGGEPYLVGRFAHTLRMRLMREHLGVDVDEVMEEQRRQELDREEEEYERNMSAVYDGADDESDAEEITIGQSRPAATRAKSSARSHIATVSTEEEEAALEEPDRPHMLQRPSSFNHDIDLASLPSAELQSQQFEDVQVKTHQSQSIDVEGGGFDQMRNAEKTGLVRGRDSTIINGREVLITDLAAEGHGTLERPRQLHRRVSAPIQETEEEIVVGNIDPPATPATVRQSSAVMGLPQLPQLPSLPVVDDTEIGGPLALRMRASSASPSQGAEAFEEYNPLTADLKPVTVTKDCMRDPINDSFFDDTWTAVAENNTKIFRRVFRCQPDNEVTNWHEYTEFQAYAERYSQAQSGSKSEERQEQEAKGKTGPPGAGNQIPILGPVGEAMTELKEKITSHGSNENTRPRGGVKEWADAADERNCSRDDTMDSELNEKNSDFTETQETKDRKARASSASRAPLTTAQTNGTIRGRQYEGIDARLDARIGTASSRLSVTGGTSPSGRTTFADQLPPSSSHSPAPSNPLSPSDPISPHIAAPVSGASVPAGAQFGTSSQRQRRRRNTTKSRYGPGQGFRASDDLLSREEAENLLGRVQGNLVVFPTEWLRDEERGNNWLYQVDMVAPLQI